MRTTSYHDGDDDNENDSSDDDIYDELYFMKLYVEDWKKPTPHKPTNWRVLTSSRLLISCFAAA